MRDYGRTIQSEVKTRNKGLPQVAAFIVYFSIAVNITYWVAAHTFGFLPLGWFCAEYVLVGFVALFVPGYVCTILLFTAMLTDLVSGACESYYLQIRDCLIDVAFWRAQSHERLAVAVLITILMCAVAVFGGILASSRAVRMRRRSIVAYLIAFAVAILGTDTCAITLANGRLPDPFSSISGSGTHAAMLDVPRLTRIPLIRLIRRHLFYLRLEAEAAKAGMAPPSLPYAASVAIHASGLTSNRSPDPLPSVVMIIVESWGQPTDTSLATELLGFYRQPELRTRYDVVQGEVPYQGGTIAAEGRELCGSAIGFNLLSASSTYLKGCLPFRLASLGYRNIALHGMSGDLFSRKDWYKKIGFQERFFHSQLEDEGLPDCVGAFVGICDESIASWMGRRLGEPSAEPLFLYWVTLNSHLPVPVSLPKAEMEIPCPGKQQPALHSPLCSWYRLIQNVHRSVVQVAASDLFRPTIFIIVGDHAPPFADPILRNAFSQHDVPYVVLLPHSQKFPSTGHR